MASLRFITESPTHLAIVLPSLTTAMTAFNVSVMSPLLLRSFLSSIPLSFVFCGRRVKGGKISFASLASFLSRYGGEWATRIRRC